jgi:hypothetical protein
MAMAIVLARGCLPGVVPSRATGLRARRHAWRRRQRLPGQGLFHTRGGNGPPWSCSCLHTRWWPTARRPSGGRALRVRCAVGDPVGPQETLPWTTSQDGAARRLLPPLEHALVKAIVCARVAATPQPLRRQSLADVTARVRHVLGTPIRRSTVGRRLETDAITPWRYQDGIVPRAPHFVVQAGPLRDL